MRPVNTRSHLVYPREKLRLWDKKRCILHIPYKDADQFQYIRPLSLIPVISSILEYKNKSIYPSKADEIIPLCNFKRMLLISSLLNPVQ
jgi:hypothetical protein